MCMFSSTFMKGSEAGLRLLCPACHVLRQQMVLLMKVSAPLLCPAWHKPASSPAAEKTVLGKTPTGQQLTWEQEVPPLS